MIKASSLWLWSCSALTNSKLACKLAVQTCKGSSGGWRVISPHGRFAMYGQALCSACKRKKGAPRQGPLLGPSSFLVCMLKAILPFIMPKTSKGPAKGFYAVHVGKTKGIYFTW